MSDVIDRINTPISTAELERRWAAIRAGMAARGIDVLVLQNNNDHMGGYVKYVSDWPAVNGYPNTIVFPRDDLMTLVRQGPFGLARDLDGTDGALRGVNRLLTTPSYASAPYTSEYDADLAATALAPYATATIGLVGTYQMSVATVDRLRRLYPQARFVEASDLLDQIKVIKSEEEQALVRRTATVQDGAMRAAFAAIRPGMKDSEVAAVAQHYCHAHGTEMGIYLCASYPIGTPTEFGTWHVGNRTIRDGDAFALLVETNGPGGMYCELGRSCVLGAVPQAMQDEFGFTLEAQRFTLGLLKPGTPSREIWAAYNDFMRRNGRPEEARLYCHGQGYDLVERPLVRHDESMVIAVGMNIVVHPTYLASGVLSWVCDNYLIRADGPSDCLHRFPQEITVI